MVAGGIYGREYQERTLGVTWITHCIMIPLSYFAYIYTVEYNNYVYDISKVYKYKD